MIASGDDSLRLLRDGRMEKAIRLEGAGALCAGEEQVFCASDWGGMIWRLDAKSLAPRGLFAGGPDMEQLALSKGGERLYALCSGADSILMLRTRDGAPMIVCRAGVNPAGMALDEGGGILAAAGGGSGQTLLLDALTLRAVKALPMPGMVCAVCLGGGRVYSLCMTETLDAVLVTHAGGQEVNRLALSGLPGAMLRTESGLLAATYGHLYMIAQDGSRVLRTWAAPGRAKRILQSGGRIVLCDALEESLSALSPQTGRWQGLLSGTADVCGV